MHLGAVIESPARDPPPAFPSLVLDPKSHTGHACARGLSLCPLMGRFPVPSFSCENTEISSTVGLTELPGFAGALLSDFSGTKALK